MTINEVSVLRGHYENEKKNKLREWDAEIERVKAIAGKTTNSSVKNHYYDLLEIFKKNRDLVELELRNLKEAHEIDWEDMKTDFEKSWSKLRNAFHQISDRWS